MLQKIRHMCFEQDVPIVFALTRKGLGKAVNKKVPVSIVGIFNYDGAKASPKNTYNDLLIIFSIGSV